MDDTQRIQAGKDLLERIEGVDHEDDSALDEIDFEFYMIRYQPSQERHYRNGVQFFALTNKDKLTRSRDALKDARPPGWSFGISGGWAWNGEDYDDAFDARFYKGGAERFCSPDLPTEYLAELHAIIQAWIWIWENEE